MSVGLICLVIFLFMAWLMATGRLSALLALPLMAVALAAFGGVPGTDILKDVIAKGALKLNATYTTTMFGAMLAQLLSRLGVAKSLVRWVAEFAGDNPFLLGLVLTAVTALLFSTLGGLGAVIMVGTIALPVMLSLGIPNVCAGALFLFGISLGGMFNIASWQLYSDVLQIPKEQIIAFVAPFAMIVAALITLFLTIELRKTRNIPLALISVLVLVALFKGFSVLQANKGPQTTTVDPNSIIGAGFLLGTLALYALYRQLRRITSVPGFVLLTPFVPLFAVLVCRWDFIPAFIAGIVFATLGSWQNDSLNELNRSIIDGISAVIPAVVLMIGIGMLITAVQHPSVANAIAPFLTQITPVQPLPYVIVFTLAAPLALYRGPLSVWGMGSGIVSLMQRATALSSRGILGMLFSVGQIQGVCDPTNTQNIWVASYLGTDTRVLLRKTMPYAWFAVFCGLVLSVSLGHVTK